MTCATNWRLLANAQNKVAVYTIILLQHLVPPLPGESLLRNGLSPFLLVLVLEKAGEIAPTAEGNGRRQGRQRAKFFDDARGSPGHRAFVIFASFCADPLSSKGRKIMAHKIPKFSKGFRTEFSGNRTLLRRCEK
jgi:hypothetical protein